MQQIDTADPTWREIKKWAEERLVIHRRVCETRGMPIEDTEGARCAIEEIKALLNFSQPSKMSATVSEKPD